MAGRYASNIFGPVTLETSKVCGHAVASFVPELGRQTSALTGERRETAWLRQRLFVALIGHVSTGQSLPLLPTLLLLPEDCMSVAEIAVAWPPLSLWKAS